MHRKEFIFPWDFEYWEWEGALMSIWNSNVKRMEDEKKKLKRGLCRQYSSLLWHCCYYQNFISLHEMEEYSKQKPLISLLFMYKYLFIYFIDWYMIIFFTSIIPILFTFHIKFRILKKRHHHIQMPTSAVLFFSFYPQKILNIFFFFFLNLLIDTEFP